MAYVFNSQNKLYDPSSQENQGAGYNKNVGSGDVGSQGGANGTPGTQAPKSADEFTKSQSLAGAGNAILQRNMGAGEGAKNTLLQPGQRSADSAIQGVQKQQNDYKQYVDKSTALPTYNSGDIMQAGSTPDAYKNLSNVLGYKMPNVTDYQNTINTQVANPTTLKPGGYGALLQKEKGGSYSKGEANLDDALFSRSATNQANLANAYGGLQNQVNAQVAQGAGIKGGIVDQRQADLTNMQNQARSDIQKYRDQILGQGNSMVQSTQASEQQKANDAATALGKQRQLEAQKMANTAEGIPDAQRAQLANILGTMDTSKFVKAGTPNVDLSNVYNKEQTDELNAITGLLGNGNNYTSNPLQTAAPTFDQDAYNKSIQQILASYGAPAAAGSQTGISGTAGTVSTPQATPINKGAVAKDGIVDKLKTSAFNPGNWKVPSL